MIVEKLIIEVARLREGGETFQGELDSACLGIQGELLRAFGSIRYDLRAERLGSELLVRGTLAQDFDAVCSRCGADFDFTTHVDDFTVSIEVDEKTEFSDLTDEIRECIILSLPSYPVCRQECKGICPTCGKNLNEGRCTCVQEVRDNRWAALDAVLREDKTEQKKEK